MHSSAGEERRAHLWRRSAFYTRAYLAGRGANPSNGAQCRLPCGSWTQRAWQWHWKTVYGCGCSAGDGWFESELVATQRQQLTSPYSRGGPKSTRPASEIWRRVMLAHTCAPNRPKPCADPCGAPSSRCGEDGLHSFITLDDGLKILKLAVCKLKSMTLMSRPSHWGRLGHRKELLSDGSPKALCPRLYAASKYTTLGCTYACRSSQAGGSRQLDVRLHRVSLDAGTCSSGCMVDVLRSFTAP